MNSKSVVSLFDTGCSKSIVYFLCVHESEYLAWRISYTTASAEKCWFPAVKITFEIEGK